MTRGQRLVPIPVRTFEDHERFLGLDVPTLTPSQLWAERVLLKTVLAEIIAKHRRDRWLMVGLDTTRESEWIRDRIAALDEEARRRRSAAAPEERRRAG
jgi:hypothetical protein